MDRGLLVWTSSHPQIGTFLPLRVYARGMDDMDVRSGRLLFMSDAYQKRDPSTRWMYYPDGDTEGFKNWPFFDVEDSSSQRLRIEPCLFLSASGLYFLPFAIERVWADLTDDYDSVYGWPTVTLSATL